MGWRAEMKLKLNRIVIVVAVMMSLVIGGCEMNNNQEEGKTTETATSEKVTLSNRQIAILQEEGLSTDYEKLTQEQQRAIVRMEEMFKVLEDKYHVEFSYIGYKQAGVLESEQLLAYPTGGSKDDVVTLKYYKGEWQDDYSCVAIKPYFEDYVINCLKEEYPEEDIKMSTQIDWVNAKIDYDHIDYEAIKKDVCATVVLAINDKDMKPEEYESRMNKIKTILLENHQIYASFYTVFVNENEFDKVDGWNYLKKENKVVDYQAELK